MLRSLNAQQPCFVSGSSKAAHNLQKVSAGLHLMVKPEVGKNALGGFPLTVTLHDVSGFVCMRARTEATVVFSPSVVFQRLGRRGVWVSWWGGW